MNQAGKREQNPLTAQGELVNMVNANGVLFEQYRIDDKFTSKARSHFHRLWTVFYNWDNFQRVQVNIHTNGTVDADDYYIEFAEEPAVNLRFKAETGAIQSVTIFGVSATDLINALDAARMAHVHEPGADLAE